MLNSRACHNFFMRLASDFVRRQLHDGFLGRVAARELAAHLPFAHHEDAIGERQHLGQIARHHQARHARGRALANDVVDLELRADVDALRRLVEQQHARRVASHLRRDDLLLVAAAQRVRQSRQSTAS